MSERDVCVDRASGRGRDRAGAWSLGLTLALLAVLCGRGPVVQAGGTSESSLGLPAPAMSPLTRARVYLAAGDYRRALEACQQEVNERPSAASYTYLTYVYHAIDAYLQHQAESEHWGAVEGLYWNLAYRDAQDLVDPPGGLARMAKEMIQESVRHQGDMHAAMATRLDRTESDRLWLLQKAWRAAAPGRWWTGIPDEWRW